MAFTLHNGEFRSGDGQFLSPNGVAVDGQGNSMVADYMEKNNVADTGITASRSSTPTAFTLPIGAVTAAETGNLMFLAA